MTDDADTDGRDALRTLARRLFGTEDEDPVDLSTPAVRSDSAVVAREGANPDPGPISAEAHLRDYTRRMFDPDYAFYEPQLPE